MKDFDHENVMKVIGISLDAKACCPELILPLMDKGDLLTYIRNENNRMDYIDAMKFCLDAARGMEYFSSKNVIHRDLAARNCLLESCKQRPYVNLRISDFGLSKLVEDHYGNYGEYTQSTRSALPIKWLAPEVLKSQSFTEKSDVWAFGVMVWEILTRGLKPYGELKNWEEITRHLDAGNRLEIPTNCDDELNYLLHKCWDTERQLRPTVFYLVKFFQAHYARVENNTIKKRAKSQLTMPRKKEDTEFEQRRLPDNYSETFDNIYSTEPPTDDTYYTEPPADDREYGE